MQKGILMKTFDYTCIPQDLMQPDIIKTISAIHEYKGRQELYLEAKTDVLGTMCEIARIQSTDASNRIEGIFTSNKRLNELMAQKTEPKSRNEAEIAGYRDVLATIHDSYDYIDLKPGVILQFHRNLYRHTQSAFAGNWKDSDNAIVEFDAQGNQTVRFKPLPAIATPDAVAMLCEAYDNALRKGTYDPLLLACLFTFDFICIHPFNDGNGRMSRLLTLLLLYRSGYLVGKYVSIEHEIEATKETYYEALQQSSPGWNEGKNTYAPIVRYLLGVILAAYHDFEDRVQGLAVGKPTKAERIEAIFSRKVGKVTKADIQAEYPNISQTTVERTLKSLLDSGKIAKIDSGRATGYVVKKSKARQH